MQPHPPPAPGDLLCPRCGTALPVTEREATLGMACPSCGAAVVGWAAPPALDFWFYPQGGKQVGPVSRLDLLHLVKTGKIPPQELVQEAASGRRVPAGSLSQTVAVEASALPRRDSVTQYGTLAQPPGAVAPTEAPTRQMPLRPDPPPPPTEDRQPPLPQIPGYEILSELGRGGMGVVYKARQVGLNRLVALKMVLTGGCASADDLIRFRAEAEAVARLRHTNVVQVYEIGEYNGQPYFTLEYVEGGSLRQAMTRRQPTPQEAARMVETLARAVQAAHAAGIVHRDLKPANVLLTPDGTPKIADFGLAKYLDVDRGQTATGAILGTPAYAAPEQLEGRPSAVGPATDVYALGVMLYEMLSGEPPFVGGSALATMRLVLGPEPAPPLPADGRVPRDLRTICMKAIEKLVPRRYATAQELADDLQRFLRAEPIRARPPGPAERTWLWCRRNPVPTGLLLTVTLGAAFGLWHLSRLSEQLVRETALEGARHQAEMLESVNNFYSSVIVERVKQGNPPSVQVRHDYLNHKAAIPIPATLTIDLGEAISRDSASGVKVALYSDYPFKSRADGHHLDAFEQAALGQLRQWPDTPYYAFEEYQGRPVLRYATARRMKASCVECHNTHPDSPKKDWKIGDVRGVLEIIRPLDRDVARNEEGLRASYLLILGLSGVLLLGSVGTLVLANRRRREG